MPTGDYDEEAAFRERMGLSPYQGISAPYAPASDAPYEPLLDPKERASGLPFASRVTYYAPGPGDRMEGGFETARPNPLTGERIPSTLDDVRLGRSPFVTVASDPSRYGQKVNLGDLTYKSPIDGKTYTLPSVFGMVHDTGSAFRGRPDKLDVATGDFRGWDPRQASAYVQADAGRRMVTPMAGGYSEGESGMARKSASLPFAVPDPSTNVLPPDWQYADPGGPWGSAPPDEVPTWLQAAQQPVVGGGGDSAMPARAALTAGQAPPSGMPPGARSAPAGPPEAPTGNLPFGIPGTFLNNPVQKALGDNFSTLLAFAGGARQGGVGQGLTQAAKASLIEGPQREQQKQLSQQQFATYQALVANGLAPGLARAASLDPKLLAQVEKMAPQVTSRGKDILGRDQFVVRNPLTGQEQPYTPGQSIGGMGTTAAPAAGVSGTPTVQNNSQEIARAIGVKDWAKVNEDLPAEEYLAQFPKEVQAAVRNKVDNNIPFPANPRQGQETATNLIGQLYAEKAGIPIDANTIKLRKEYLANLQKTNPASVGGQRQGFNLMAQHGATVTEAAVALANSDLGLTPLSKLFNMGKNLTSANAEKVNDFKNGVQKWNAEVEKLYAGGQGSITAREHAELLINENASPREIAGTIRSQQELVGGKLKGLQAAHDEALPPRFRDKHKMIFPETEDAFKRMTTGVAELKKQSDRPLTEQLFGGTGTPAAPSARRVGPPMKPGNYVYDPATKQMTLQP